MEFVIYIRELSSKIDNDNIKNTEELFQMLNATNISNHIVYLTNMETNYTIVSPNINQYGITETRTYQFNTLWEKRISPNDIADVKKNLSEILSGERFFHNMIYQVMRKDGTYADVLCSGKVLKLKPNI